MDDTSSATPCDDFSNDAIRRHYKSQKSQAVAYLMTVGAKALVLSEINNDIEDDPESPSRPNSMRQSFDEEGEIKRVMANEEHIREFQRVFSEKPGVLVHKRGRNGEFRKVYLRMKEGKYLVWKSRIVGRRGSFSLTDSLTIESLESYSDGRTCVSSSSTTLRLRNKERSLDLLFESPRDATACSHLCLLSSGNSSSSNSNPGHNGNHHHHNSSSHNSPGSLSSYSYSLASSSSTSNS